MMNKNSHPFKSIEIHQYIYIYILNKINIIQKNQTILEDMETYRNKLTPCKYMKHIEVY